MNYKSYILSIYYGGKYTNVYYQEYELNESVYEIELSGDSWTPLNDYIERVWDYETTTLYLDPIDSVGVIKKDVVAKEMNGEWFVNE